MSKTRKVSIILSDEKFSEFFSNVFRFPLDLWLRVEKPIKEKRMSVQAIRVYLSEFMKEINSTVERGEYPRLLLKRTVREKTGKGEVEIVFLGTEKNRHIEELGYFSKHPSEWVSYGEIVLTLDDARELIKALESLLRSDKDISTFT